MTFEQILAQIDATETEIKKIEVLRAEALEARKQAKGNAELWIIADKDYKKYTSRIARLRKVGA